MNPIKELIQCSVDWWVTQLNPCLSNTVSTKIGDKVDTISVFTQFEARITITEKQITIFKEELNKLLHDAYLSDDSVTTYSQYGASGILKKSAIKARISLLAFPFKTSMLIDFLGLDIKAKKGYGAKWNIIKEFKS